MNVLAWLGKQRQLDRELEEEIQAHLALAAQDRVERGQSPSEARYAARREFGNSTAIKETTREVWIWTWVEQLLQDVKFALRWYRKNPGFALTAVAVMALGIGANTAIFSIINGVLLKPLPYSDPDRLMFIREAMNGFSIMAVSYPNFLDWRARNKSFTDLAAFRSSPFNLTGSGDGERLRGRMVSASFFSILNVKPILGCTFNEQEDRAGGRPVVLISEVLWKRRFSGDPGLVGRTLTLNAIAYTVVGILPSGFQFELTPFVSGGVAR